MHINTYVLQVKKSNVMNNKCVYLYRQMKVVILCIRTSICFYSYSLSCKSMLNKVLSKYIVSSTYIWLLWVYCISSSKLCFCCEFQYVIAYYLVLDGFGWRTKHLLLSYTKTVPTISNTKFLYSNGNNDEEEKRKRHRRCISQKRYEKLSKYHGNETKHVVNTLTIFTAILYLVVLIFNSLSTLFSILFAFIFSSVALIVFPRNFFARVGSLTCYFIFKGSFE